MQQIKNIFLSLLLIVLSPALFSAPENGDAERSFACSILNSSYFQGNCAYSPYSLYAVLSILRDGARGKTAEEISQAMHLDGQAPSLASYFKITDRAISQEFIRTDRFINQNALWINKSSSISSAFQKQISSDYKASVSSLDYSQSKQAAQAINDWANGHTEGKITDLVKPSDLSATTQLIATNITYLKAQWLNPFDPQETKPQAFYKEGADPLSVPTMRYTEWLDYYEDDSFQCAFLPFRSNDIESSLSFLIVLPKKAGELPALLKQITLSQIDKWLFGSKLEWVQLSMPRFKIRYEAHTNALLRQLGMVSAYSTNADFSGINGQHNLMLNDIAQQTLVEIDENGVIAAAATKGNIGLKSFRETAIPKIFSADRPFLFLIVHEQSRTVLFIGMLENPLASP